MSARPHPPAKPQPLIGAQVSTAGGLTPVPRRAVELGAEVIQIFDTNPRTWRPREVSPQELISFVAEMDRNRLPLFLHTIYLINLASPDEALRARSRQALVHALLLGALTGATGVVTHVGSHRGEGFSRVRAYVIETVVAAYREAAASLAKAADAPGEKKALIPPLLLETAAGMGHTVGGSLAELSELVEAIAGARPDGVAAPGICLDTAHLFAAGYPVHEAAGLEALIAELDTLGLLERVGLVHLNDSKTAFGSHRDYHENLGRGHIGYEALARVVGHPRLAGVPFVLEVPGLDGHGPDAPNVRLAKTMREEPVVPPPGPAPDAKRPTD